MRRLLCLCRALAASRDNPFSEAHFKTLKYRPEFPERFGSIEDARSHCRDLFAWYNNEHQHGGLGLLTPFDVYHDRTAERVTRRAPSWPRGAD